MFYYRSTSVKCSWGRNCKGLLDALQMFRAGPLYIYIYIYIYTYIYIYIHTYICRRGGNSGCQRQQSLVLCGLRSVRQRSSNHICVSCSEYLFVIALCVSSLVSVYYVFVVFVYADAMFLVLCFKVVFYHSRVPST